MERAGRALATLKLQAHGVTDEQLARAAWAPAVGRKIADRTKAIGLVRKRLIVQVEDALWQRNLFGLREQILRNMAQVLGRPIVEELEFRVAVPKRQPARAASVSGAEADEAEGIRDFVLRSIYKSSREKATA